jgi:hypothetical protein
VATAGRGSRKGGCCKSEESESLGGNHVDSARKLLGVTSTNVGCWGFVVGLVCRAAG